MNLITTNELILVLYLLASLGSAIGTYKSDPVNNQQAGLLATFIGSIVIGLLWVIVIPMAVSFNVTRRR